jgi:hypothetical protein
MKKSIALVLGIFGAAIAASAQTPVTTGEETMFYARPAVVFAFPGNFDSATGGALALGAEFKGGHSVEAEYTYFKSADGPVTVKFAPILANYDYRFGHGQLGLTVGVSVGATNEKANMWWYTNTASAFTYGLRTGLSYDFTHRISFDAHITTLHLENTSITTAGNMALVRLGVNFRL